MRTREIDGILYEAVPFNQEKWILGEWDKIFNNKLNVELIDLYFFENVKKYAGVDSKNKIREIDGFDLLLLKQINKTKEYKYVNVYSFNNFTTGGVYNDLYACYIWRQMIGFEGITRYTIVNNKVTDVEFFNQAQIESMLNKK